MTARLALLALFAAGSAVAASRNACVACHATEVLPIALGHSFAEWHASPHGRASVGCDRCHGGDPAGRTAEAAHRGMLPSSDPASRVHDRNLPQTCGACHGDELAAFEASGHGKVLAKGDRGASCRLCHGAMATSLPTPRELDARCAACHERPVDAQAALAVLAASKISIAKARRTVRDLPRTAKGTREGLVAREHELEKMYAGLVRQWHGFRPKEVLADSRDLLHLADALRTEAEIAGRSRPRR